MKDFNKLLDAFGIAWIAFIQFMSIAITYSLIKDKESPWLTVLMLFASIFIFGMFLKAFKEWWRE